MTGRAKHLGLDSRNAERLRSLREAPVEPASKRRALVRGRLVRKWIAERREQQTLRGTSFRLLGEGAPPVEIRNPYCVEQRILQEAGGSRWPNRALSHQGGRLSWWRRRALVSSVLRVRRLFQGGPPFFVMCRRVPRRRVSVKLVVAGAGSCRSTAYHDER